MEEIDLNDTVTVELTEWGAEHGQRQIQTNIARANYFDNKC